MTPFARSQMVNKNFVSLGLGLMETGMAWFWSDARVKKWFDVEGLENLTGATRGVMVVGIHFMSLVMFGIVMGICLTMIGKFRAHNEHILDKVQYKVSAR